MIEELQDADRHGVGQILFIHGFASCGLGGKSKTLIEQFGRDRVLTPDLAFRPDEAIEQLQALLRNHPVDLLVGSSMGGHYATCLNRHTPIPTVLINPAIRPSRLLAAARGKHRRWCDNIEFEVTAADIRALENQYRPVLGDSEHYLVLLQTADEVLDYRVAQQYYDAHQQIVEPGGNHRFENLADYLPAITAFRNSEPLPLREMNPNE